MSAPSAPKAAVPRINLLCLYKSFSAAFDAAIDKYYPALCDNVDVTTYLGPLHKLPDDLQFDAIVSPANSYGRLDGAFDDAISRALSPKSDYHWVTKTAQKVLYEKWKGFAPPGTCTVIPLTENEDRVETQDAEENDAKGEDTTTDQTPALKWNVKYILLCPTMRIPEHVKWDREVIYECIWSMLCAIDLHNKAASHENQRINSILMTPLATGVGMVPYERWAEQCVLAIRDWIEASENPEKWSNLGWGSIFIQVKDVRDTWGGNKTVAS